MLQKNIFRDKGSAMSFSLEYTGDFHGKTLKGKIDLMVSLSIRDE